MGRRAQRRRQTTTGPAPTGQGTRPPAAVPAPRSAAPAAASSATTWPGAAAASDEVSLDRLADLVAARRLLEGEIGFLVDALAADGVGWPAIAGVLGVSRQAARQAHHRRQAGSSPAAGSSAAASTR